MTALRDTLASLPEAVFADLMESDESYLLVFDLPGVSEDTLSVNVSGNRLSIEAHREKAVPDGFWFREENRSMFLDVTVPLPLDAIGADATARLDKGVLEVTVPKSAETVTTVPIED